MKSSNYQGVKRFEHNELGRDFIIGDIHGCLHDLKKALKTAKFNPTIDRLFSVGDLIDRGPNPLEVIAFCRDNNVHVVLGNHELSILSYIHMIDAGYDLREYKESMTANGQDWIFQYTREQLEPFVQYVCTLPYLIYVEDKELPFFVVHASIAKPITHTLIPTKTLLDLDFIQPTLDNANASLNVYRDILFSRNHQKALSNHPYTLEENPLFVQATVHGEFFTLKPFDRNNPFVYCGHTIFPRPVLINNHLHIDTGAFLSQPQFAYYQQDGYITMIAHKDVKNQLR